MASLYQEVIKERYSSIATAVAGTCESSQNCSSTCCMSSTLSKEHLDPITRDLYTVSEASSVPSKAVKASLGCGNPTAMVEILPGQTVLDLGSGTWCFTYQL